MSTSSPAYFEIIDFIAGGTTPEAVAALRSVRVRALEHGEQRIVDLYTDPGADRQTVA